MIGFIHRVVPRLCTSVLLGLALPAGAAAQFGTTIDLQTGPLAWQPSGARDPLISSQIQARYLLAGRRSLRPELLGGVDLGTAADGGAVQWDIGARLHTGGIRSGAWLGAAFGAAGAGSFQHAMNRLEGGVRRVVGPARVNLWVARTGFGVGSGPSDGLGQDSAPTPETPARKGVTEYTDVGSRVMLGLHRYELGLSLMHRIGSVNRGTGWNVSGTWWMTPSVGLLGVTGYSLPQLGFSFPGGRYGTLGLRLSLGVRSPTEQTRRRTAEVSPTGGPALVLAGRRLTIKGAPARQAEVMGDFTDWKPEPLTGMGDGRWALPTALSPGVHHLNVRFDGGRWVVPSGTSAVDDGFGGRVGLLVVR